MCPCDLLLLLLFASLFLINSTFISKIQSPFPHPKYNNGNRTAILLSGQFGVANYTILSSLVKGHLEEHDDIHKYFTIEDPPTAIATHLEYLIRPLALYGGVDLFIYIPARAGVIMNATWDGDPSTYEVSSKYDHCTVKIKFIFFCNSLILEIQELASFIDPVPYSSLPQGIMFFVWWKNPFILQIYLYGIILCGNILVMMVVGKKPSYNSFTASIARISLLR